MYANNNISEDATSHKSKPSISYILKDSIFSFCGNIILKTLFHGKSLDQDILMEKIGS